MMARSRSPVARAVSAAVLLLIVSTDATSDERLMIVQPGYPGSTEEAKGFVDRLRLEIRSQGGPVISVGSYHNREKSALAAAQVEKPTIGVVSLGFYLAHRKKLVLRPLLWSRPDEAYHILVKKGTAKTLEDLKGQSITGTPLVESEFVRRLVLSDSSVSAVVKSWKTHPIRLFSKGVRDVRRGRKRAVLLSERELNGVKKLRSAAELEVIHTTSGFPTGVVVAFGNPSRDRIGQAIMSALIGLESSDTGRDLLKTMGISGFTRIDARRLKAFEDAFDRVGPVDKDKE